MYKILIHKPSMAKDSYTFAKDENGIGDFATDDKDTLIQKYLYLLDFYTKEQVKIVEEVSVDFKIDLTDGSLATDTGAGE